MSRTTHHRNQRYSDSTPSKHTHMYMTVPQRAAVRNWESETKKTSLEDLDRLENPPHGRKPHVYYW